MFFCQKLVQVTENSHFVESFKWAGGMPNIRNEWVRRRDHQRGGVLEESSQKLISKMNSHSYLRMYVNSTFFLATCLACILELLLTASTIYHILARHFYFRVSDKIWWNLSLQGVFIQLIKYWEDSKFKFIVQWRMNM